MNLRNIYSGKRVLVTGHTGFKGSWLCEWLLALGAEVHGIALQPPTKPSLFEALKLTSRMHSVIGDIRDKALVHRVVDESRADFLFHLAAQPLVRLSYELPLETYETNVMGTAQVLEAVRLLKRPCTVVVITTDKCYENLEWLHSYRECDPVGGYDPYSSSKGAAELVVSAYRRSFFGQGEIVRLASARAGNVIGGGDWARDRIVPDCVRALQRGQTIPVRNKIATRPWQHVLEPLGGYLWLAGALSGHNSAYYDFPLAQYLSSFNFGPWLSSNRTVAELVTEVLKYWPGQWADMTDPNAVHEAKLLNLAIDKAFHLLNWSPVWGFEETVRQTVSWYRRVDAGHDPAEVTRSQINLYTHSASNSGVRWSLDS